MKFVEIMGGVMKQINFIVMFVIAASVSMVNPVDAVCIDNKVTVYTNIKNVAVTIQTPDYGGCPKLRYLIL